MNGITRLQAVPRAAIDLYLKTARVPLTAVGTIVGRGGDAEWGPALAFSGFDARVRRIAGSVLLDDQLVHDGRRRQAKVAELRRAAEFDRAAKRQREEAKAELQERGESAADRRRKAEEQAAQRQAELDEGRRRRKQQVEERAQHERKQERQVRRATEKAVGKQERAARRTELGAKSAALSAEREAAEAKADVVDLDQQVQSSKEARTHD